jgi:histone acetyltransferase
MDIENEEPKKDEQNTTTTSAVKPKRGQLSKEEELAGIIKFQVFTNDRSRDSSIILTGLKNIYQKQLPKMPREYIARLVFDRNHDSIAIVKKGLKPVGGITYRKFEDRKFAEIVFCAITATEQVKGYGSHLMNHLKHYIRSTSQVEHFLTYADNYAIGYFKKQGFTSDVSLDRSVWSGYIKDYEGGTLMQCTMLPRINYLEVNDLIDKQRKALYDQLEYLAGQGHKVYAGLSLFDNGSTIDPKDIPGLVEAGWKPGSKQETIDTNSLYPLLRQLLNDLTAQTWSWPFKSPVDPIQVPDYYDVITDPMGIFHFLI